MLALLRHPVIVRTESITQLDGVWALATEYIEGVDLADLLRASPLPVPVILEVVAQVASALGDAWDYPNVDLRPLCLVHGDIKPSTVRITPVGQVKLLDFGVTGVGLGDRPGHPHRATRGSPRFMAPEGHQGVQDHASDMFSLALVWVVCLTHRSQGVPPAAPEAFGPFRQHVLTAARQALTRRHDDGEHIAAEHRVELMELLGEMLSHGPQERPTGRQVVDRLRPLIQAIEGPRLDTWADGSVQAAMDVVQPPRIEGVWTGPAILSSSTSSSMSRALEGTGRQVRGTSRMWVVGVVLALAALLATLAAAVGTLAGR